MVEVKSKDSSYAIQFDERHLISGKVNEKPFKWDVLKLKEGSYHILKENRSYNLEVIKADHTEKEYVLKVNGNKYEFKLMDRFDILLDQMGMSDMTAAKVSELKAPMPGLVLEIMVEEGMEVQEGDPLLVLEAMKMENVLKSPANGKIQKINATKSTAVEKNEILIQFE